MRLKIGRLHRKNDPEVVAKYFTKRLDAKVVHFHSVDIQQLCASMFRREMIGPKPKHFQPSKFYYSKWLYYRTRSQRIIPNLRVPFTTKTKWTTVAEVLDYTILHLLSKVYEMDPNFKTLTYEHIDTLIEIKDYIVGLPDQANFNKPFMILWEGLNEQLSFGYEFISCILSNHHTVKMVRDKIRYFKPDTPKAMLKQLGLTYPMLAKKLVNECSGAVEFTSRTDIVRVVAGMMERRGDELVTIWYRGRFGGISESNFNLANLVELVVADSTTFGDNCNVNDYILLSLWLGQYSGWVKKPPIYISDIRIDTHIHTILSGFFSWDAPMKIDLNLPPNKVFSKSIANIRKDHEKKLAKRATPLSLLKELPAGIHQLRTGKDLYNEGSTMSHCIGGWRYIDLLDNPNQIFLHLDGGEKHSDGATIHLSLEGKREWGIREFSGYNNQQITPAHPSWGNFVKLMDFLQYPEGVDQFKNRYEGLSLAWERDFNNAWGDAVN